MNNMTEASSMTVSSEDIELKSVPFSVDSALLRELGERLVGKPHTALAELIKNSYDADATKVVVRVRQDRIEVSDNGQGMILDEFSKFWMRIGTPHKQAKEVSRRFKRPLTGSKGVGRLAVQFLAHRLEMHTVAESEPDTELIARVNWDEAVVAGELTNAKAQYRQVPRTTLFPSESRHGTTFVLSDLKQKWDTDDFEKLAREIWTLQPPFRTNQDAKSDLSKTFTVELDSPDKDQEASFNKQTQAFLGLYYARITGKLVEVREGDNLQRKVRSLVEFRDGKAYPLDYDLPQGCNLNDLEFEIRVFYVGGRQRFGIKVAELGDYLMKFGGVHIYDSGFHLPYYGPDTDWLGIEVDHSHRRFRSALLPDDLQPKGTQGLRYLPTNGRLFGVVRVDTSKERVASELLQSDDRGDYLAISLTRDRLVDNKAFSGLEKTVRYALDYYAVKEAQKKAEEQARYIATEPPGPDEAVPAHFQQVEEFLAEHRENIPGSVYEGLQSRFQEAVEARSKEAKAVSGRVGLLGALATAGISALAYEHEVSKQFQLIGAVASQLDSIHTGNTDIDNQLKGLSRQLEQCVERSRATRALFSHLMDEENREMHDRFRACALVSRVAEQMGVLLRGVEVDTSGIEPTLRLPQAGFAEWSAIFQNVMLNAVNATLDSPIKRIVVLSRSDDKMRAIVVQDTGSGVDLKSAEELFDPFVRKLKIPRERQALGLGGTGLGLSIVRMIASSVGCKVAFVAPSAGFSTAFELSWKESS